MGGNSSEHSKTAVRTSMLAARRSAWGEIGEPVDDAAARASALHSLLAPLPAGSLVLGYLPFADEPDPGPVHTALRLQGIDVALPRLGPDRALEVVPWPAEAPLVAGPRGTRTPTGHGVDPSRLAAALVPALAVDPVTGVRLGRGGGSYDRLLPRLPGSAPVVALLAGARELVDLRDVAEPHDVAVGLVALPEGVRRVGGT